MGQNIFSLLIGSFAIFSVCFIHLQNIDMVSKILLLLLSGIVVSVCYYFLDKYWSNR